MKSVLTAVALLLAAGSFAGAGESFVRDTPPAAVIGQFSQAIPPEPPVVGELRGHHRMASGAACCRMRGAGTSKPARGTPCGCCQKAAPQPNAKAK